MTFPPSRTMQSLAAIVHGLSGEAADDGAIVVRHDQGHWIVTGDEIDELERLGLVDLPATAPGHDADVCELRATERGRYWAARWERQHNRRKA